MTFIFNDGIPAAGNNPSNDQPIMLSNNVANAAIWEVDHIGFNTNGGGLHEQVTFLANQTAPGLPSGSVAALYSNLNNGIFGNLSSLFFQDSSTLSRQLTNLSLVTTTPGATGFGIRTPWGLILNWGSSAIATAGTTISFQVGYTTTPTVLLTPATPTRTLGATAVGTANFVAASSPLSDTGYFLAIGV